MLKFLSDLSNFAKYDQVIAIVNGEPVKISGVWSGLAGKKQRAENALKKYSDLFKQLHNQTIDEVSFVEQLESMKPATTNLQKLFDALELFSTWKAAQHLFGKDTDISLEPVQDREIIDALIMSYNINESTDTTVAAEPVPLAPNATAGAEKLDDVFLAGGAPDIELD